MPASVASWTSLALVGGAALISILETFRPLRRARERRSVRVARNLTLAVLGFATVAALQAAFLLPVSAWAIEHRAGLLGRLPAASPLRLVAAFLLLDYTLWVWHWLNHKVKFFWRFHRVHHVDRDMDASTGVRFHFGELALSAGYRALQIAVIGADPLAVSIWQTVLLGSVLFHHSNLRLPVRLERGLVRILVTPRMHGIHHSDFRDEANSNWSSILSIWDFLQGTARLDVPQDDIEIGVAAYQDPEDVTLVKVLRLPIAGKPDDWARSDGRERSRGRAAGNPRDLRA
jgi:sterol desaturase/sphingolipid hydroxylase (fatty acid hydroxylase superfamily)